MACTSIAAVTLSCSQEARVAGLETAYMIAYKDLAPVDAETSLDKVTYATNGLVNGIGLAAGKLFVEIQFLRSNAGLTVNGNVNLQTGTSWFTPEFSLTLADLSLENGAFVASVMNQPVALIVKSRTGKYFFTGGNGQFQLSGLESGTGTAEGDLLGYKLNFTGIENKPLAQVDSTIISGLITA